MKNFSKVISFIALLVCSLVLVVGCGGGNNAAEEKVIKIGQAPFDYEVPFIEITKQIASEQGYEVEVVAGDVGFMFLSLTQGDIDAWPGVWLPSIHKTFQEKYGDQYVLGSEIFKDAPVGWVAPEYLDVDSIAELKGNEDAVNGKVTGLEAGAGMMLVSEEIIEGYELDLELVSGSLASMMAEADYAITHEEPIIFLGWRPHTMMRIYDLKFLDDPKGYWDLDSEYWGIRKDLAEYAPDMNNFFNNFEMSLDEVESFLYAYQEEGQSVETLAKDWIEKNRSDIDAWLKG
ncbi:MAG: glycine betaine ABC transporter substrate-binding protein [Syntrophomonadaceae bacterium]|jgi:glycine betaine/proline transport system substrate-binding protein|nr:glycine betaine ABC transporter substrate-binding protein [Syntrophomonadaceae bacterium]